MKRIHWNRPTLTLAFTPLVALGLLTFTACGGGQSATPTPTVAATTTPAPTTPTTTPASPTATASPIAPSPTTTPTSPSPTATGTIPSSGAAMVETTTVPGLGTILTDAQGYTLYLYEPDNGKGPGTCTGTCATLWPPLTTSGQPTAGAGVTSSLLGTTPLSNGSMQVTYNGWPLYRYSSDQKPGDVNGQGKLSKWYVVSPQGSAIQGAAGTPSASPSPSPTATTSTTSSSSGSSY